jgi:hypothetical protein
VAELIPLHPQSNNKQTNGLLVPNESGSFLALLFHGFKQRAWRAQVKNGFSMEDGMCLELSNNKSGSGDAKKEHGPFNNSPRKKIKWSCLANC